jgi:hypothetical protein
MTRCSSPLNHRRLLIAVPFKPMKTMGEHHNHRCHRKPRVCTLGQNIGVILLWIWRDGWVSHIAMSVLYIYLINNCGDCGDYGDGYSRTRINIEDLNMHFITACSF